MRSLREYVTSLFTECTLSPEQMHSYQNMAVDFVLRHPFCALFIDLGLGKTCISLTAILNLVMNFEMRHALVVAPVRVANETWPTEIRTWTHTAPLSFVHVRHDDVVSAVNMAGQRERSVIKAGVEDGCHWSVGMRSDTSAKVNEALNSVAGKARIEKARLVAARKAVRAHFKNNPATVHIVNREQIEFLVDAWGRDWPYDVVILDESSSYKDYRTGRFKALRRIRPLIKRMVQLTATPAAETYLHLFAQIFLLDEGARFGRYITKFRSRYFDQNHYSRKYTLREGADVQIAEKIADITLTLKAEDYLDLEKPVMLIERIKLDAPQQALYDQMRDDLVVTIPSGETIEAETAAALSQKLLQMTSGVLYETKLEDVGDGNFKKRRVVHKLHDHKIEKLQTIVEEAAGEPILVAYWHESSLDRLKKAFPQAVAMDKQGHCVKAWNAGKIPMLLVHPQSAAHGLNLQRGGRRIVIFDIPWSLELYLQLIGRLARQGQTKVVMVHHLVVEGTIDEAVVAALLVKNDIQEILFKLLKRFRRKLDAAMSAK